VLQLMPSLTGYVKSPRCSILTEWQVKPFWDIADPDFFMLESDFLLGAKMHTYWKSSISFSSAISYCKVKSLQLGTMPWRNMRVSNTSACTLNLSTRGRWSLNMEVHKSWVPGRLGDYIFAWSSTFSFVLCGTLECHEAHLVLYKASP
jgi:hypothetical protein